MKHDKIPSKWYTYKIGGVFYVGLNKSQIATWIRWYRAKVHQEARTFARFSLKACKSQAEIPNSCTLYAQSLNSTLHQRRTTS